MIKVFVDLRNNPSSLVGLNDKSVAALMQLVNVLDSDESNNYSDDYNDLPTSIFEEHLNAFFEKLDLDGDGLVTWWEWKEMLHAASLVRSNIRTKYLDHLDPLIVGYRAAHSAMEALRLSDSSLFSQSAGSRLKSNRVIAWGDQEANDLESILAQLPPESRGRLAESIAALRKNKSHQGDTQMDEETKTRIRVARDEVDFAKRELGEEKNKSYSLEYEINKIRDSNNALKKSREDLDIENLRAKALLIQQADANKERVAAAHWNRIKKGKAADKIRRLIIKGIERLRRRKLTEGEAYKNQMVRRLRAAVKIQSTVRRIRGHRRAKRRKHSITVICRAFKNWKDKKLGRQSLASLVLQMNKAANKLQNLMRTRMGKQKESQRLAAVKKAEAQNRSAALAELMVYQHRIKSIIKVQAGVRRM